MFRLIKIGAIDSSHGKYCLCSSFIFTLLYQVIGSSKFLQSQYFHKYSLWWYLCEKEKEVAMKEYESLRSTNESLKAQVSKFLIQRYAPLS